MMVILSSGWRRTRQNRPASPLHEKGNFSPANSAIQLQFKTQLLCDSSTALSTSGREQMGRRRWPSVQPLTSAAKKPKRFSSLSFSASSTRPQFTRRQPHARQQQGWAQNDAHIIFLELASRWHPSFHQRVGTSFPCWRSKGHSGGSGDVAPCRAGGDPDGAEPANHSGRDGGTNATALRSCSRQRRGQ